MIAVGRLNHQKGHDLLLQAWQEVEARHEDWHLDIYGEGKERERLLRIIAGLQLKRACIHDASADIYSEYLQSDFLVCSSRWESFGLVIIEAMSCGIPVVAFDCDNGPRNIITQSVDGFLVENSSVSDLTDKMLWLIEHSQERRMMGVEARKKSERFSIGRIFDQYVETLQSI